MNRHITRSQASHLLDINIDAHHIVAQVRKTGPGGETHIPRSDHRDLAHKEGQV